MFLKILVIYDNKILKLDQLNLILGLEKNKAVPKIF